MMYRLETERTILDLLTTEDLPEMEIMAREEDTFKYLKKFSSMSAEAYTQFLQTKLDQIRDRVGYHWAVRSKSDGRWIGAVNLNRIGGTTRLQIGAQLKRDYWGQGYASELLARLVRFGIDELKLPAVYGVFEKENNASRRLLEKLGFVFEKSYKEQDVELEVHQYPAPAVSRQLLP